MKPKAQELYEQNKLETRPDLHVILGFDRKVKIWKFIGWYCSKCNQGLKTQYVANKHKCNYSKVRRGSNDDYLKEAEILTVSGKPYKVFEY